MQFAHFVSCGFNQIVNNLAKIHYRWGHKANVVIRMPTGGGMGAGPFHSQSNEAWFTKTPGLKVVYPSNPHDAKGLLIAAFNDPNPVMYFEHKGLYRMAIGEVADGSYEVEIGKANVVSEGEELTIITYGMGVHWASKYKEETGHDIEIIDLRSLSPIDYDAIDASVKKTNRVIIGYEASYHLCPFESRDAHLSNRRDINCRLSTIVIGLQSRRDWTIYMKLKYRTIRRIEFSDGRNRRRNAGLCR